MSVLCVPPLEDDPWPTLGPGVCDFIEQFLVFGPGDLRGEPARLDTEKRALIYRMYEVFPRDHPQAGRRRFKRVGISLRKGSAKSEFAAWIAAAELHPDAPVRCIGWDAQGQPIGGGVKDCYIPLVAYTEEQSEELAYHALKTILEYSPLAGDFDIGLERIIRRGGDGKAVALANSPDARDGARTTFQVFDETHRLNLPRLIAAHDTMLANIPKRRLADAWTLEITTAPAPGQGSIAERTMQYARLVADGKHADSRLFFFHRQASDDIELYDDSGNLDLEAVKAAVIEASGPVAEWSDIDGIVEQWRDPTSDKAYLERVWLNRLVRSSDRAFDASKWRDLAKAGDTIPDGELITLGFDGSEKSSTEGRQADSTALIATHIRSGFQWVLGIWEHPYGQPTWEIERGDVEAKVADAFRRWDVWRMYADPARWGDELAKWTGEYGEEKVIRWATSGTRHRAVHGALLNYRTAIETADLSHDGNRTFAAHIGNACKHLLMQKDERGEPIWVIYKERPDSPHKIDAAMAGCLSWEARRDALASGVLGSECSIFQRRLEEGESLL